MVTWLHESEDGFAQKLKAFLALRETASADLMPQVASIIANVRDQGDKAVFEYTAKWDRLELDASSVRVTEAEVQDAVAQCDQQLLEALELSAQRIRDYHERQVPEGHSYQDAEGNRLGWQWRPVKRVGLYVPGGQAVYPSSVLMNAIPALAAGVQELAMVVPMPDGVVNPVVMAAAHVAGITEIYKVGGAQAVAALAYGTESIAPVDKIVGPGNAYVAEAKRQVFGKVGIDMIAGPSEICVVADAQNDPSWIAADLLSQAEHSADAQSILIVDDEDYGKQVESAVATILAALPRKEIAAESWDRYGAIIVCRELIKSTEIVDIIAPEHVEYAVEAPAQYAERTQCAGAIFMGRHTPEALGDYVAGPSHVLPTIGTARFSSGLSVYDFLNKQSLIEATQEGFQKPARAGVLIAESEGLDAHALSMKCRLV